jgi:hypothetical protein
MSNVLRGNLYIHEADLYQTNIGYNTRGHYISEPIHTNDVVKIMNDCSDSYMRVLPFNGMDVYDNEYEEREYSDLRSDNGRIIERYSKEQIVDIMTPKVCYTSILNNKTRNARTFVFPDNNSKHYTTCSELDLYTEQFVIAMAISMVILFIIVSLICCLCTVCLIKFIRA